jgi:hypothetical protein
VIAAGCREDPILLRQSLDHVANLWHRGMAPPAEAYALDHTRSTPSHRKRARQIENEALQKLRRFDGERLFAYHQEL